MGKHLTLYGHHVMGDGTNQSQGDLTNQGHFDLIWSSREVEMDQYEKGLKTIKSEALVVICSH